MQIISMQNSINIYMDRIAAMERVKFIVVDDEFDDTSRIDLDNNNIERDRINLEPERPPQYSTNSSCKNSDIYGHHSLCLRRHRTISRIFVGRIYQTDIPTGIIGAVLGLFIIFTMATTLASSIILKRFEVPTKLKIGDNANLTCQYELQHERLYALKWYRDDREFYRFLPGEKIEERKQAFKLPGIHIDLYRSSDRTVALRNVTTKTAGNFKCEALIEGSFKSVAMERKMNIIDHREQQQTNYYPNHHQQSSSSSLQQPAEHHSKLFKMIYMLLLWAILVFWFGSSFS